MISRTTAYRATVALIWALALWHSWTSRGLFVDGANFLVHVVRQEAFFDFYDPRRYANSLYRFGRSVGGERRNFEYCR